MNTKDIYNRPEIEVIECLTEGIIANSPEGFYLNDEHNDGEGGAAGSRKRNIWD